MNSARHANRAPRGQRGRGQGRSRGGGLNHQSLNTPDYKPVPNMRQVIPGAPVSIVLKADQPTGKEVQGIVAELLTRGDHPRGIKVRLQDGRVGRVQRMVSLETAEEGARGLSGLGRNGEVGGGANVQVGVMGPKYTDYRVDSPDEPPSSDLSLADYVVTKGKKRGKLRASGEVDHGEGSGNDASEKISTSTCPVCGSFEGDEAAVAHHVSEHFD